MYDRSRPRSGPAPQAVSQHAGKTHPLLAAKLSLLKQEELPLQQGQHPQDGVPPVLQ